MRARRRFGWKGWLSLLAAVLGAAMVYGLPWIGSQEGIVFYLEKRTPLNSTKEQVLADLKGRGIRPIGSAGELEVYTSSIPGGKRDYPPGHEPGAEWLAVCVAEYRIVFVTSVEAFYIFNAEGRLVEIAVRKSTDAL